MPANKAEIQNLEKILRQRLHRVRQKQKAIVLLEGLMIWVGSTLIALLLLLSLESILWLPAQARTVLVVLFLSLSFVAALIFVVFRFIQLLRRGDPADENIAIQVGEHFPDIKDKLADALQVFATSNSSESPVSQLLAAESLRRIYDQIKDIRLTDAIQLRMIKITAYRFLSSVALFILALLLFGKPFSESIKRLSRPGTEFSRPKPFNLRIETSGTDHLYGKDLAVRVLISGAQTDPGGQIELSVETEGKDRQKILLDFPFEHKLSRLKKDTRLSARSGHVISDEVWIRVYRLPEVRTLFSEIQPPAYTAMEKIVLEPNMGAVSVLEGSRVDIRIKASKKLSEASIRFDSGKTKKMSVQESSASGWFMVEKNDAYRIEIQDTSGYKNENPVRYTVTALKDSPPVARILSPGEDTEIEKGMLLDLTVLGDDDYGLSRSALSYWLQVEGIESDTVQVQIPLDLSNIGRRRSIKDWTWNLNEAGMLPEDRFSYFFEVWDNDAVHGPKSGKSRIYTVRFPSVLEIYEQVEKGQDDQVESLEDLYGQSLEMQERLSRISDELKTGKEAGWETRKNLEAQAEQLQEMEKTVEQLEQELESLIDQLEKHDLASEPVLQKYMELQKLYEEITTPEFKEAMAEFQELMQSLPEEALKQEADNLSLSQESFMKSIERTLNLLKRLQVEQKMDELLHRLEDMKAKQDDLNKSLKNNSGDPDQSVSDSQKDLQKEMEDFENDIDGLAEKMSALPNMPNQSMEEMKQQMQEMDLSSQMQSLSQQMKNGNMDGAQQQGRQTSKDMESLSQMMQSMQEQMMSGQKQKVMAKLGRSAQELLNLSMQQEKLMQPQGGGELEKQAALMKGLGQISQSLYELSQETFAVTPEMGRALGEAAENMQQALDGMQQAGRPGVARGQQGAMGALNQSVMALQQSMDNMSGSQSGLGAESFMQGLEQMGLQQMALNQRLMDLLNQGQLSLAQQAELQRIAAQQRAIQQQLGEMLRQGGERNNIPGRLSQLLQEMEEVIQDLVQKQAGRQTVQRQQRILSRLLEAQNSLQKRDTSRKRQGKTGREFNRSGPQDLIIQKNALQDRLRRDLLHLRKEGYSRDYERLIRKYLDAISGKVEENQ